MVFPKTNLEIARVFYNTETSHGSVRERVVALWESAQTVSDLAALNAAYLSGVLPESPFYLGQPNEETDKIADELIALTRAGFLTSGSQPFDDDADLPQKPFVDGLVPTRLAHAIREALRDTAFVYGIEGKDGALDSNAPLDKRGFFMVTRNFTYLGGRGRHWDEDILPVHKDLGIFDDHVYMWVAAREFGEREFPAARMILAILDAD